MTEEKNEDTAQAFVAPILDAAFEKCIDEGRGHSCCIAHLSGTIESGLMKNVVRNIFARHLALNNDELPTDADMKAYSLEILVYMKEYYNLCLDQYRKEVDLHTKRDAKLH